ncbi:unnamed protein product [Amoebophrya sp. A120]|nr:unnamed protein product [Amoebophrya sp. A120]|eukprot:GSA120T00003185001.1
MMNTSMTTSMTTTVSSSMTQLVSRGALFLLYLALFLSAAPHSFILPANGDAASVAEFFHMVDEYVDHVPPHMTICQFGLVPFHELLTHQIFARLTPPKFQNTYVHFLQVDGLVDDGLETVDEKGEKDSSSTSSTAGEQQQTESTYALDTLKLLKDTYGDKRVNGFGSVNTFDSYCSMIIVTLHYPHVSFEDVSVVARKIDSIFLAYIKSEDSCHTQQLECRWMSRSWEAVLGEGSFCGENVCLGMVPSDQVFDEVMAQSPMVECSEFIENSDRPASWTTQWQQDWFIYHNFFSKEALQREKNSLTELGEQTAAGVTEAKERLNLPETTNKKLYFAEVGAYHPFKYSNTLFFEKCLEWDGICVEPNPYHAHLFKTYRRCALVPHCVWSSTKTVTMSFAKDMIEAAVPDDATGDIPDINTYDPSQQNNSKKPAHQFDAVCLSLDSILQDFFEFPKNEFGQTLVHYISLDAEHAEVEILKAFPFWKYDIKVWLIEVQPDNFYAVDAILLTNGYGKVAVLGGDHVYVKLGNIFTELDYPSSAKAEQEAIMGNKTHGFHEHKQPKIDYSTNRPRSAMKKKRDDEDGEEGKDEDGGEREDH